MQEILYISHYALAATLIAASFVHRGYGLVMACRWSAAAYLAGLLFVDLPAPEHWLAFMLSDCVVAALLLHFNVARGAVAALLASAAICAGNALGAAPALLYDYYEPLALTLNLAQVYYLTVAPRIHPRDRRLTDRLPRAF